MMQSWLTDEITKHIGLEDEIRKLKMSVGEIAGILQPYGEIPQELLLHTLRSAQQDLEETLPKALQAAVRGQIVTAGRTPQIAADGVQCTTCKERVRSDDLTTWPYCGHLAHRGCEACHVDCCSVCGITKDGWSTRPCQHGKRKSCRDCGAACIHGFFPAPLPTPSPWL